MDLNQWQQHQLAVKPEDIKLGLDSVSKVAKTLNIVDINIPIVTVAGTNGKGSTITCLSHILKNLGLKTGVYTSPHLINYTERIKINNQEIEENVLCEYFSKIKASLNNTKLTYFEYGTLAAMMSFVDHQVEVIILEVGLGGRLDASNAWDADIAILTNVDLDHQDWLGNTKEQIGFEKANIFRGHKPAIIGETKPPQSVLAYANKINADVFRVEIIKHSDYWQIANTPFNSLEFPALKGEFQLNNVACAIMAAFNLVGKKLNQKVVNLSLGQSKLAGRLQVTHYQKHEILLDVAHNPKAVLSLKNFLGDRKITAIFGIMKDKDIASIIKIINPNVSEWHLFPLPIERAEICANLAAKLLEYPTTVKIHPDLATALNVAIKSKHLVSVFGSFITVAEFLKYVKNN